jgi:hypothetical protein
MDGKEVVKLTASIFNSAVPVIRINGLIKDNGKWFREMTKINDSRIGPWWFADYTVINQHVWDNAKASLYLTGDNDLEIHHVGETGNKFKDRWRLSPAKSFVTKRPLSEPQLFHSSCWSAIENADELRKAKFPFEVRVINGNKLRSVFENWTGELLPNELTSRSVPNGKYVKIVEKDLRQFRSRKRDDVGGLFSWNKV